MLRIWPLGAPPAGLSFMWTHSLSIFLLSGTVNVLPSGKANPHLIIFYLKKFLASFGHGVFELTLDFRKIMDLDWS